MDGFIARYFVLLQVKTMALLMVISAVGTPSGASTVVEKPRAEAAIRHSSSLEFDRQSLKATSRLITTKWRRVLDEWAAPLMVWAAVIAMTLSVAGMLLAEE